MYAIDQVDTSVERVSDHGIESCPVFGAGAGDSLVPINAVFDTMKAGISWAHIPSLYLLS